MNTSERQALRLALVAQGLHRQAYTNDDDGRGAYQEVWGPDSDPAGVVVVINWADREQA